MKSSVRADARKKVLKQICVIKIKLYGGEKMKLTKSKVVMFFLVLVLMTSLTFNLAKSEPTQRPK